MEKLEFYQNILTESAKEFLNARTSALSAAESLIQQKKEIVMDRIKEKTFCASDICGREYRQYEDINPNATMKAITISCGVNDDFENNFYRRYSDYLGYLHIHFMQNPEELLGSKAKYTNLERKYLRELSEQYDKEPRWVNYKTVSELAHMLWCLKHHVSIYYEARYTFTLYEMTNSGFLNKGLTCNGATIMPAIR